MVRPEGQAAPVWGCVLIGGRSRRMGRAKHLIKQDGITWLELTVARLGSVVDRVVISGAGTVPESLGGLAVVRDIADAEGPLAGILAVTRRYPDVSWLVTACDLPWLQVEALEWLLSQRRPGVLAVLPDLEGNGRVEPLLAWYDWSSRDLLEHQAASGIMRLSSLAGKPGIVSPRPPQDLRPSWRNINTPEKIPDP